MKKVMMIFFALAMVCSANAQMKFCKSYSEYKAGQWKPYESLTDDQKPDSARITYDGTDFTIKTNDKAINEKIKKEVLLFSADGQLFINQKPLRDEDGVILPINHYTRALPYKGGKLLVVCYHVSLGQVLDLVNVGLDVSLLATGHYTLGGICLATDLLLTNENLMESHVLYLLDKEPDEKGRYIMTRLNDEFMEKLLRDDPVTFSQYQGRQKKSERQSAANILPILVKKGLIQDYHHKK